jgi:diguanylate cyclase
MPQNALVPEPAANYIDHVATLLESAFPQDAGRAASPAGPDALHDLLVRVMARLAQAAWVSGSFFEQVERDTALMEQAGLPDSFEPMLSNLIEAVRTMARDSQNVHDELRGMQESVQTTDQQIARLHAELDRLALLARHDPLTGALNRKGMDEAMLREAGKVRRLGTPLSIAMLDIDNFKKLNDSLGHAAGDAALRHLAVVARECLRPQDTMARYGGEEFLVLLPDTPLERGVEAMGRLQRELAQRPFASGASEGGNVALVHITFSAGVSQLMGKEVPEEAVKRADEGMYRAKRAGKNRVAGSW